MDESALRRALASLDDCGSSLHVFLKVATASVVIGVALEMVFVIWEYLEDLHDFNRGIVHAPDRPSWLLFALGFLGAALVALGVGGELYAESKIATLETCIRKGNDTLSLLLSKEAGDAATSAKAAHAELDAVKKEAREMESDILAQGPRGRLIRRAAPELIRKLAPFGPEQKVVLYVCTTVEMRFQEGEMIDTWASIADILADKGAQWSMPYSNEKFWNSGFSCDGIQIGASSRSSQRTKDAVKALGEGLFNVLPQSTDNSFGTPDPEFELSLLKRGPERPDAPWALEAKNPDLIVVMIGRHPLRGVAGQKSKNRVLK